MTHIYTLVFTLLVSFSLAAQDSPPNANAGFLSPAFTTIQANLRALELAHERRIGASPYTIQGVIGITSNPLAAIGTLRLFSINDRTSRGYVSVEPRYYYNLASRAAGGKNVAYNSGGFFGLRARLDGAYTIFRTEEDDQTIPSRLSFTPRWGIRTQIGRRTSFELALGINTRFDTRAGQAGFTTNVRGVVDWRFAYRF